MSIERAWNRYVMHRRRWWIPLATVLAIGVVSMVYMGARTYVESPPDLSAAAHDADRAARDTIEGHGRDPDHADVDIVNPAGAYERCVRITVEVSYSLPAVNLPVIGGYGRGFAVSSHHSELIDPWRDDVPGAGCA